VIPVGGSSCFAGKHLGAARHAHKKQAVVTTKVTNMWQPISTAGAQQPHVALPSHPGVTVVSFLHMLSYIQYITVTASSRPIWQLKPSACWVTQV
jgi:hypothetical protein